MARKSLSPDDADLLQDFPAVTAWLSPSSLVLSFLFPPQNELCSASGFERALGSATLQRDESKIIEPSRTYGDTKSLRQSGMPTHPKVLKPFFAAGLKSSQATTCNHLETLNLSRPKPSASSCAVPSAWSWKLRCSTVGGFRISGLALGHGLGFLLPHRKPQQAQWFPNLVA